MRRSQTPPEQVLWGALRNKAVDGLRFRHQAPIGRYIVDFFRPEARLIVEVDGITHVDQPRDRARDKWLQGRGYTVLHFWNNEVMHSLEGVLEVIRETARTHRPPRPSPSRGEGQKADPDRLRGQQR